MAKRTPSAPKNQPKAAPPVAHFSAGKFTTIESGAVKGDALLRERMMALKARSINRQTANASRISKTAGLFPDGELGPANIADSNNIGYYSYEFPADSLEMPQSRPEELRFYRLAYDRDPIVGRAIDLHTELPLSKMQLEKPKCSVESFADYVFDYYQRLVNDTQMFQLLIEATREYHTIGESFLYVIQPDNFMELEITDETLAALKKGRGYGAGISPMSEGENAPIIGQEDAITDDWIHSAKQSSKVFKRAHQDKVFDKFTDEGIGFEDDEPLEDVKKEIKEQKKALLNLIRANKVAKKAAAKSKTPVIETPEFLRWFGNSKVVDKKGKPLAVNHGTKADFDTFDLGMAGSNNDPGMWGTGFYFSPDRRMSIGYGHKILRVYLSIQNPFFIGYGYNNYGKLPLNREYPLTKEWADAFRAKLISMGYDGVFHYCDNPGYRTTPAQIVAFYPHQIKLVRGNSGQFNPENPSITASLKTKTAAPGDPPPPPAGGDAPPGGDAPDAGGDAPGGDAPEGDLEGGEGDDGGMGGDPMGGGGGGFGGGGGGGMGGGMDADPSQIDGAESALSEAAKAERDEEVNSLKRYLHLLERKKELLEELTELVESKKLEKEIFSHVVNQEYEGFARIQMLAPEKIELANDEAMGPEPQVMYKPTEQEKLALLENQELDNDARETLEEKGQMRLNTNPFKGPFVIHFARKKAGYELHGRSLLQRCMRTIIYREKLRQVQTTLASRNMTPKTVITAPGVSEIQVAELRAHADEAKADPDYTIVTNYELTWNEISSQGRLLTLSDEYQHLNSDIAIGLGFSPEILIGEGLYGGNRIQLELMNTTYTQYREALTEVIENKIFKPLAQLKGFFEMDNYGRPRWIYPKITFGRMALRDSGDLYEMLFNLYSKGSLPVSTLLEFLNIDSETVKRSLETDLYTVSDAHFGELKSNIYASVGQAIVDRTDVVNRVARGLTLKEQEDEGSEMEGTGEGI